MINKEFHERTRVEDDIESSHLELERSSHYGNTELYSLDDLRVLGFKWEAEIDNPIRSERSRKVAEKILRLITFECAYRNGTIDLLINYYS